MLVPINGSVGERVVSCVGIAYIVPRRHGWLGGVAGNTLQYLICNSLPTTTVTRRRGSLNARSYGEKVKVK